MITRLTIVRYPSWFGWAGFLSMALLRGKELGSLPILENAWLLIVNGRIADFGSMDAYPEVSNVMNLNGASVLPCWCDSHTHLVFAASREEEFVDKIKGMSYEDIAAKGGGILNSARRLALSTEEALYTAAKQRLMEIIRISQLSRFWQHVDAVAQRMSTAPGFITSVGIGEVPWIKQATFSIWESKEDMKAFAYRLQEHAEVVRKTRQEKWYSEELFVRFQIIDSKGSLKGNDPIKRNP